MVNTTIAVYNIGFRPTTSDTRPFIGPCRVTASMYDCRSAPLVSDVLPYEPGIDVENSYAPGRTRMRRSCKIYSDEHDVPSRPIDTLLAKGVALPLLSARPLRRSRRQHRLICPTRHGGTKHTVWSSAARNKTRPTLLISF